MYGFKKRDATAAKDEGTAKRAKKPRSMRKVALTDRGGDGAKQRLL